MELYHASSEELEIGDKLSVSVRSDFYPTATSEIDANKPDEAPARSTALHCSDSSDSALFFLKRQKVSKNDIHLYKVQVESFHRAPFSLTHVIDYKLQHGESVNALVEEYWHPTKEWNHYEYLVPELEVLERIEVPDINQVLLTFYTGRDYDLAKTIR